jgi:hypothetical protein
VLAFAVTLIASFLLIVWLSEELRLIPRGPGWLVLCLVLAVASAKFFGRGGKAARLSAGVVATVAERVMPFSSPDANEEAVWAEAAKEFDSDSRRAGLYAKALSSADGDENRAKAFYLRARVAELKR